MRILSMSFFILFSTYNVCFPSKQHVIFEKQDYSPEYFVEELILDKKELQHAFSEFDLYTEHKDYFIPIYQNLKKLTIYCDLLNNKKEIMESLKYIYPHVEKITLACTKTDQIDKIIHNFKNIRTLTIVNENKDVSPQKQRIIHLPKNIEELILEHSFFTENHFKSSSVEILRLNPKKHMDKTTIQSNFEGIQEVWRGKKRVIF